MNKETLLTLIKKDIRELASLTQGFSESKVIAPSILALAESKTLDLLSSFQQLTELAANFVDSPISKPDQEADTKCFAEREEVIPLKQPDSKEPAPVTATNQANREEPAEEMMPQAPQQHSLVESLQHADAHSLNELLAAKDESSLAEAIKNNRIDDLHKALNIAERFRFQRELFSGNGEKLNATLSAINEMNSEEDAMDYIRKLKWNSESPVSEEFIQLVKRRFLG